MPTVLIWTVTCILLLSAFAAAQSVAVLTPEVNELASSSSSIIAEKLSTASLKVVDPDLGRAAYASAKPSTPLNMTQNEAKLLGATIGCNFVVLVTAGELRRTSMAKDQYWEAYSAIYLVSSRSGRLVYWSLAKDESDSVEAAKANLRTKMAGVAEHVVREIASTVTEELKTDSPRIPSPEDFAGQKGFRAPIPYNRFKPEYTSLAYLYGAEGTVDIAVDLDGQGKVTNTEVIRWLGYGLDESVEKAVRAMNWRPAEIDGKPLAMRVLLRYNFKKIEKN
jgi:TonB family protein